MISKKELFRLRQIQRKIASQVTVDDSIKFDDIKTVAGFDVIATGDLFACAAAVVDLKTLRLIESAHSSAKAPMQYIPTLLAFREGPIIMETYEKLKNKPDALMIKGHGMLHPYLAGLATYIGVSLDKPAVGVAKSLICGEKRGNRIFVNGKEAGAELVTRKFAKPIFISTGNKLPLDVCVEIIKATIVEGHKFPEPIHLAHKLGNRVKKQLKAGSGKNSADEESTEE
ncbi:hypothetical protein COT48_06305 [Candidatus Woesearchaeota archaeon CG08_land_8_20_14_0_20_47_9]|nr:MAG: hypothetical protein AUJ69_03095 [Candidatus Woesearchaeota archaeon CG1_02_47_18]PIO03076.1 MAG: hypothetical protein COT48_06305 [Candidatus Woesearchaeota archaeon CG08_land_8_20_14_0_20_47_9]HII30002.1 endonuclease V [Candidatus Woesearchaeota archaeon]